MFTKVKGKCEQSIFNLHFFLANKTAMSLKTSLHNNAIYYLPISLHEYTHTLRVLFFRLVTTTELLYFVAYFPSVSAQAQQVLLDRFRGKTS